MFFRRGKLSQLAIDNSLSEIQEFDAKSEHSEIKTMGLNRFSGIIGQSEKMQDVFTLVESVADSDSTILINGETGTGKGLIAKAIHNYSPRKNKPFVQINCGAIPENLLESELFGHVKGAFTGATSPKQGKFDVADGGTIFLDEIGDMSHDLQVKILRVLEEKEFEQVGGCKTKKIDVRIIAATHRDLEEEVQKGNFREDLFYRLYVIPVFLPPLRERKSDIPLMISHFLRIFNEKNARSVEGISEDAMKNIMDYPWKGNVRELKNMIESLVVMRGSGIIERRDLPKKLNQQDNPIRIPSLNISQEGISLSTAVSEFEKNLIVQCLEHTHWVKKKAAKLLQVNRTTLVEKIKRHQLEKVS
jgi:sigma-54 dependent transcriptional regulator, flagellar regulatory protein